MEELAMQQRRFEMVNEANKEEIKRIDYFNKVVRKQFKEPKKKDETKKFGWFSSNHAKSTERGDDQSDDPNISKMSDESGSSFVGSSDDQTDNDGDNQTRKSKPKPGKKKGKPSNLMSG